MSKSLIFIAPLPALQTSLLGGVGRDPLTYDGVLENFHTSPKIVFRRTCLSGSSLEAEELGFNLRINVFSEASIIDIR